MKTATLPAFTVLMTPKAVVVIHLTAERSRAQSIGSALPTALPAKSVFTTVFSVQKTPLLTAKKTISITSIPIHSKFLKTALLKAASRMQSAAMLSSLCVRDISVLIRIQQMIISLSTAPLPSTHPGNNRKQVQINENSLQSYCCHRGTSHHPCTLVSEACSYCPDSM